MRGAGLGLAVTPLTAAVLAAVRDSDLGQASAINDAASRVGGVIAIALVPLLIGAGAGGTLAGSLADGYRPAMLVIGALCVAAAVVSLALRIGRARCRSGDRAGSALPRLRAARDHATGVAS